MTLVEALTRIEAKIAKADRDVFRVENDLRYPAEADAGNDAA